jgi:hypothetical protein
VLAAVLRLGPPARPGHHRLLCNRPAGCGLSRAPACMPPPGSPWRPRAHPQSRQHSCPSRGRLSCLHEAGVQRGSTAAGASSVQVAAVVGKARQGSAAGRVGRLMAADAARTLAGEWALANGTLPSHGMQAITAAQVVPARRAGLDSVTRTRAVALPRCGLSATGTGTGTGRGASVRRGHLLGG